MTAKRYIRPVNERFLKEQFTPAMMVNFLNAFARLLKALWLYLPGVVAVLAIYYLLTGVEQGIDVVIQSGELLDSGVLSVLAVFLWSFLVWYSCRTLSYIKQHRDDEIFCGKAADDGTAAALYRKYGIPARLHQHIPRMLAYNCFVSIQVAVFHLPTFFAWSGTALFGVVLAHNLFYFLLDAWCQSAPKTRRRRAFSVAGSTVVAGYGAFIIWQIIGAAGRVDILSGPLRHTFWLSCLALVMFLMQLWVVFLFILRRRIIDDRRKKSNLKPSRMLEVLGYNPVFNAAEAPYFRFLNGTAAVALGLYAMAIFEMSFASLMGPMALSLLALGVLTGLLNLLTLASIRNSFNVGIVLITLAFLFGQYRDPYPVRFLETQGQHIFSGRPDAQTYLAQWFERRISFFDSTDTTRSFPVYIVLSNGGASRAGRWTSAVLSHLQDTSYRADRRDSFKDHLLCIAGASGGAVGNSAFYSLLKAEREGAIRPNEFSNHTDVFFEADFLTYSLGRLLGPDMFRHLMPFNVPLLNRADALETAIESNSRDTLLNGYFQKAMSALIDTTGALPALFINTTQVDNGMPGVISTIRLPEHSLRQDVLALVDSMGTHAGRGDLRLSTATVLSSRFPYVSPAGKVFDRYYVDGGYFDNSGAGTVLEFIRALNRFLTDTARTGILKYRDRFTFHILHITNSEIVQRPARDIHPLTNDLLSPLLTLAGMQGASTSVADGVLVNAFRQFNSDTTNAMILYSLYDEAWDPDQNAGAYEEGYPMSWVLSDYQINRMERALQRANRRNLWKFGWE